MVPVGKYYNTRYKNTKVHGTNDKRSNEAPQKMCEGVQYCSGTMGVVQCKIPLQRTRLRAAGEDKYPQCRTRNRHIRGLLRMSSQYSCNHDGTFVLVKTVMKFLESSLTVLSRGRCIVLLQLFAEQKLTRLLRADHAARAQLDEDGFCVIGSVLKPDECAHVSFFCLQITVLVSSASSALSMVHSVPSTAGSAIPLLEMPFMPACIPAS